MDFARNLVENCLKSRKMKEGCVGQPQGSVRQLRFPPTNESQPEQRHLMYTSERHAYSMLDAMNVMRKDRELCDIILVVGKRRFYAHKVVLSACSPYFHAMFLSPMAERNQSEVVLQDINEDAVEQLIEFCYSRRILIEESNVQTLLPAAAQLQMQEIQDKCCDFLKEQLHYSNVLGIRRFAFIHSCTELQRHSDAFTQKNFDKVVESDEFLECPPKLLIEILKSDELQVSSEEMVYNAAMRWIKHNVAERKKHLAAIMEHVRFALMPPHFLVGVVSNDVLMKFDDNCRDFIDEAKDFMLLPHERPKMQSHRTRPRNPQQNGEVMFAVGGWCSGDAIATVERYDPQKGIEWSIMSPMSKRRCGVGVAVLNDLMYAVGGHDGTSYLNCVERYDPVTNTWSSDVTPTSSCRTSVGVAVLNGCMYAVGGQDGVSCLTNVERFDPNSNTWTRVTSMTVRRLGVGVAVLDGCLYAVGGSDGTAPLNSVERYDPRMNKWSPVASMGTRRKHLGVAVFDSSIYAVGGRDDITELSSAERYNPMMNTWQPVVAMTSRRSGVGLSVVNGTLTAVGGFDGACYLKTFEVFDRDKNCWMYRGCMNYRRLGGGVGVVKMFNS